MAGMRLTQEGRQLLTWARDELLGLQCDGFIQRAIKSVVEDEPSGPALDGSERGSVLSNVREGGHSDDDWDAGPLGRVRRPAASRKHRLRFEREWNAPWIVEALREIWQRGRGLGTLRQ